MFVVLFGICVALAVKNMSSELYFQSMQNIFFSVNLDSTYASPCEIMINTVIYLPEVSPIV